jgi:hypothetical protein
LPLDSSASCDVKALRDDDTDRTPELGATHENHTLASVRKSASPVAPSVDPDTVPLRPDSRRAPPAPSFVGVAVTVATQHHNIIDISDMNGRPSATGIAMRGSLPTSDHCSWIVEPSCELSCSAYLPLRTTSA